MRRVFTLALAAVLVAVMSGCTEEICRERTLLGFFLCDESLVFEEVEPETHIVVEGARRDSDRGIHLFHTDSGVLRADTVGADDPLYPPDYIASERWKVVEDGAAARHVALEQRLDELRDELPEVRVERVDVLRALPLRQVALRPREREVDLRVERVLGRSHCSEVFGP